MLTHASVRSRKVNRMELYRQIVRRMIKQRRRRRRWGEKTDNYFSWWCRLTATSMSVQTGRKNLFESLNVTECHRLFRETHSHTFFLTDETNNVEHLLLRRERLINLSSMHPMVSDIYFILDHLTFFCVWKKIRENEERWIWKEEKKRIHWEKKLHSIFNHSILCYQLTLI